VAILNDGLLAQSPLATQIRKEIWHALGEWLTGNSMTRVANKSRHDQSEHLLDWPADLPRQAWSRRPRCAPVIRSRYPVTDERIDVRREILVPRRTSCLREHSKVHLNRHAPRQISGRVTTLNQPCGVLLDRRAQP
jgi:hypothetical protein